MCLLLGWSSWLPASTGLERLISPSLARGTVVSTVLLRRAGAVTVAVGHRGSPACAELNAGDGLTARYFAPAFGLRISVSIDSRLTLPGIDLISARTDSGSSGSSSVSSPSVSSLQPSR